MWRIFVFLYLFYYLISKILNFLNKNYFLNLNFLILLFKITSLDNFGKFLDILKFIIGEISFEKGLLKFGYSVPSYLCHFHPSKESYLDLSSILALTDEITTILIIREDQTFRPGTSSSSSSSSSSS